ncbi:hypothetical protein JNUCC64_10295 [Streptomyces sp. JNUCC 64]
MISIKSRKTSKPVNAAANCGRSAVASLLLPGFSNLGTGLSGVAPRPTFAPVVDAAVTRERIGRPTEVSNAVVAVKASAYGFTATAADTGERQTSQHHTMWAFRGLEPWSHPA